MRVLQEDPGAAEAFFLLGVLAADHDNHPKAIELFDRAASLGHDRAASDARAARSALALNRREEAVLRARRAAGAGPVDAGTQDTIGVVFSRTGLHAEAITFYRAATTSAPERPGYWYNLGAALQFSGEFEEARQAFDACLDLDPNDTRARVARVSVKRQTPMDNDLSELRSIWARRSQRDPDAALQIAHALAKTHEDLDEPLKAMEWLALGKAAKRAMLRDRQADDAALFDAAGQLAQRVLIAPDAEGDGPVFITGMPRTGTTLVDRILSSHPEMNSAGELSDFSVLLKRFLKTPGAHVLDVATLEAAAAADLHAIGREYCDRVTCSLGLTGRFTDKMPLNIFFAPAILAAIPSARVICLRRHPADTALSNYRQLFATSFSYYSYAYDLEQTARYVVAFNALIDTLAEMLPVRRFKVIDYEAILDDQEAQTRSLLEFCGLPFDPACLRFHENTSPVATASSVQVRQPLYKSSRGRWRRYRPALDPALKILSQAGLIGPGE